MADYQTLLQLFRTGHELNHTQWMEIRNTLHDGPRCIVATRYSCNYSYRDHIAECGDDTSHEINQCTHYDGQNFPFYEYIDDVPRLVSDYESEEEEGDNDNEDDEQ